MLRSIVRAVPPRSISQQARFLSTNPRFSIARANPITSRRLLGPFSPPGIYIAASASALCLRQPALLAGFHTTPSNKGAPIIVLFASVLKVLLM